MSVTPDPSIEPYARPQDLADYFPKFDEFRSETSSDPTSPTREQVTTRLKAASDWIDSYTGHAWRPRQVRNEYLTLDELYYWSAGTPLGLTKRQIITPLDSSEGDKLEIWTGEEYDDWVSLSEYQQDRDEDFWIEAPTGQLYLYRRKIWFERHKEVRITYRYGREWPDVDDPELKRQNVPRIIRDVCARWAAAYYLEAQQYRITTPGNEEAPDAASTAETWREQCRRDLEPYKEIRTVGSQ